MATNPTLLTQPIAANGAKNVIPNTTSTAGAMSQDQGFPAETALPLGAGGVAPSREDFNGAFNLLGGIAFYAQKGWTFEYDATQDYYKGCIVIDPTDGKRYECIADVSAGGSVPSADTTHWKIFIDITQYEQELATKANRDLSNLTQAGQDSFLERDFTIIYPNGGTEATPATCAVSTRYIENNPFTGYRVYCVPEVLYDGKWYETIYSVTFGSGTTGGIIASQIDDNIEIKVGSQGVYEMRTTVYNTSVSAIALPTRIKVWKIGKIPT